MEFALASGTVKLPGAAQGRPTTLQDTFLFGSGVKPFTATAVMALRDSGKLSLDDPLEQHIDAVLNRLRTGASLRGLFGDGAGKITVRHVLRMESGVQDFDFPFFDQLLLQANETYRIHSPYEFVEYASTQKPQLLCEPGSCSTYSSNNFVLAGLVLLAHSGATEWWELDLASFLPAGVRNSLRGSFFFQKEMLDERLTVPGYSAGGWAQTPPTTIFNQSSTILGWTCGNLVSTALDMAGFIWDLLGPEARVLSASSLAEMTTFKPLSQGWAAGTIQYGAGVMLESVTWGREVPHVPEWGTYVGHGGDTFGFLSEQGIVSGLNASVAIVAATDSVGFIVTEAFCHTIKTAAWVLKRVNVPFRCFLMEGQHSDEAAPRVELVV